MGIGIVLVQQIGAGEFTKIVEEVRGPAAVREWQALEAYLKDFMSNAAMFPPAAMRGDIGAALTVGRYLPDLIRGASSVQKLTIPFSEVLYSPPLDVRSVTDERMASC